MKLRMTAHARERARQMGVSTKHVKCILEAPDVTNYPSSLGNGFRVAVAGNIAVPYTHDHWAVTVLWKGKDGRGLPDESLRVGEG